MTISLALLLTTNKKHGRKPLFIARQCLPIATISQLNVIIYIVSELQMQEGIQSMSKPLLARKRGTGSSVFKEDERTESTVTRTSH